MYFIFNIFLVTHVVCSVLLFYGPKIIHCVCKAFEANPILFSILDPQQIFLFLLFNVFTEI